jgi:hypothetical protein
MRGIYYAYAIRLVTIPGLWQGFVMLGTMIILTHFVSIGNVINNLSQIEMSHIDTFVYNAVRTTEIWTLLLIGLFMFFSLLTSLHPYSKRTTVTVSCPYLILRCAIRYL